MFVIAALCCWGLLCLLFWQGSWQLLYHPESAVTRTPASVNLSYDSVAFAVAETGQPRLSAWWIPAAAEAPFRRITVLYLHRQDGNLGNAVNNLAALHSTGVNIFAFDYRGYGQSQFAHPSEVRWRQDTEWALSYLTGTRQIGSRSIVLDGEDLGANLALEAAAAHPELAGVIVSNPLPDATGAIFNDPRARLVPARLLVSDRYGLDAPAARLHIPLLWFQNESRPSVFASDAPPGAFSKVNSPRMLVSISPGEAGRQQQSDALSRWLADLPAR